MSQSAGIEKHYRADIDGLRAVAVLGVLAHHFDVHYLKGGYLGVDVFFVISGFVITRYILSAREGGQWRLSTFYWRRLRRLFPAYLVTILATLIVGYLLFPVGRYNALGEDAFYSLLHIQNLYAATHKLNYFSLLYDYNPLLHLWSLNVEEHIYLFWPIIIIFCYNRLKSLVPLLIILSMILSMMAANYYADTKGLQNYAFYHVEARVFEFSMGALILFLPRLGGHSLRVWVESLLFVLGMFLIGYAFSDDDILAKPFHVLPACVGAMLVIYAGESSVLRGLLANKLMVFIGLLSYSLYLVHWPIVVFMKYYILEVELSDYRLKLIALIISFIAAFALHRSIERPLRLKPGGEAANVSNALVLTVCPSIFLLCGVVALYAVNETYDSQRITPPAGIKVSDPSFTFMQEEDCSRFIAKGRCVFNPAKKKELDILVIGDSQQGHYWRLYKDLADKHDLNIHFWTRLTCAPIFDVDIVFRSNGQRRDFCDRVFKRWKNYIEKKQPDYVILTGAWYLNYEILYQHGLFRQIRPKRYKHKHKHKQQMPAKKVFKQQLTKTINFIRRQGSKVIVLSPPPVFGSSAEDCYLTPQYLLSQEQQYARCAKATDKEVYGTVKFTNRTIKEIARGRPGVRSILLSDLFCEGKPRRCLALDDRGFIAFTDHHHVSTEGMDFITRQLSPRLWKLVKPKDNAAP